MNGTTHDKKSSGRFPRVVRTLYIGVSLAYARNLVWEWNDLRQDGLRAELHDEADDLPVWVIVVDYGSAAAAARAHSRLPMTSVEADQDRREREKAARLSAPKRKPAHESKFFHPDEDF